MNGPQPDITLRTASLREIPVMLGWAAAEGWNPGLDDAEAFHAADPEGFFVAEDRGEIVAAISVVNHGAAMAFLGLFICRPDRRRSGIGRALWTHAIAHAADRTVGLDGVAAQEASYARSGFIRTGASRRFAGNLRGGLEAGFATALAADATDLAKIDRDAVGYDRTRFIAAWTAPGRTRKTVVSPSGDGFATIRLCREGCKIGPVVAPDAATALALARGALALIPAETVVIDLPESSPLANALVRQGFRETFRTARMNRGRPPQGNGTECAIATMELG